MERKAAAADREVSSLTAALHQEKERVQQLHELLTLKEQQHRYCACPGARGLSSRGQRGGNGATAELTEGNRLRVRPARPPSTAGRLQSVSAVAGCWLSRTVTLLCILQTPRAWSVWCPQVTTCSGEQSATPDGASVAQR